MFLKLNIFVIIFYKVDKALFALIKRYGYLSREKIKITVLFIFLKKDYNGKDYQLLIKNVLFFIKIDKLSLHKYIKL